MFLGKIAGFRGEQNELRTNALHTRCRIQSVGISGKGDPPSALRLLPALIAQEDRRIHVPGLHAE